ncbi:hypothetical protein TMEN_10052 [Trichophyton mentagrophytes]|uniref:N-acetyltransferase domain-containing protein n=3 Tax=Trichophyton TaxID=5550 RepID=A0A059JJ40_TRIIM|nr:hypothetical protein TESG_08008 [Trichophyton tonsurans CBS 112818]EGE08340.1 hypothetical protein TEQG_07314 [Trichophyton equinum CBS 127.97]EZF29479.1 hypothetical protein H101_06840 [Trichophyton interdigitale H6]KDB27911.1 hypothetical protein H109_00313 [Trichophyton interdigitale MR816]GBF67326.1 hypothetical protein TMEN_10052 [Trichophyton mentagrophytes]
MKTARLELVRITSEHLEGFHAIWSNAYTTRWSSRGQCKTLEDSREWMSGLLLENNPLGENYAVLIRSDLPASELEEIQRDAPADSPLRPGGMIGSLGTFRSDPVPEVGYTFHQSAWGRGFATEAVTAFMQLFWANKPQFDAVEAFCDPENVGSVKVLLKAGFTEVERQLGVYEIPSMTPSKRDLIRFRATRKKLN